MGRDKARLRLGNRTLLSIIQAAARATGVPVRVIRRDLKPGFGPLGGILTALHTTSAESVLFLACDMPFITPPLLARLLNYAPRAPGLFVRVGRRVGFPFRLRVGVQDIVVKQIRTGHLSLQQLAQSLRAKSLAAPARWRRQLQNANTPGMFRQMEAGWARQGAKRSR
jgi:molybdenum cofactor guanylyltransferase